MSTTGVALQQLFAKVEANPYDYAAHVELIGALRGGPSKAGLRNAREGMASRFPLSPPLWLQWLEDEKEADAAADFLDGLFRRATRDYVSLDVWLEYGQWVSGSGADEATVRAVWEEALTAVGSEVGRGAQVWESYRTWEAILADNEEDASAEKTAALGRVEKLFRRQLLVPLRGMDEAFAEFQDFLQEQGREVDDAFRKSYEAAEAELNSEYQVLEKALDDDSSELKYNAFKAYIEHEVEECSDSQPQRVVSIFERALIPNCLNAKLWLRYLVWLDKHLSPIPGVCIGAYERASRNVPWSADVWSRYLAEVERKAGDRLGAVFEETREAGMTEAASSLQLWLSFVFARRRLGGGPDELHGAFEDGAEFLAARFGPAWDADFAFRSAWAEWIGGGGGQMDEARLLWDQVLNESGGTTAALWLDALRYEMRFHWRSEEETDWSRVRKLYRKGLNTVTDAPPVLMAAFLRFENENGTREDLDVAIERVEQRQRQLKEQQNPAPRGRPNDKKHQRKRRRNRDASGETDIKESPSKRPKQVVEDVAPAPPPSPPRRQPAIHPSGPGSPSTETVYVQSPGSPKARLARSVSPVDKDGFKVPIMQPPQKRSRDLSPKPPSPKPASPGSPTSLHPPALPPHIPAPIPLPPPPKPQEKAAPPTTTPPNHDEAKSRTAFVSNIDFRLPEKRLRAFFAPVGRIVAIRLVGLKSGMHKGYGFVEFSSPEAVTAALQLDRTPIDERPVFVHRDGEKREFQFKQEGFEKSKLFVRNISTDLGQSEVEGIFAGCDGLKSVRLATYKNGKSKGIAFVEFTSDSAASAALMSLNNKEVAGQPIDVAISNPPPRKPKQPADMRRIGGTKSLLTPSFVATGTNEPYSRPSSDRRPQMLAPRALNAGAKAASAASAAALGREMKAKKGGATKAEEEKPPAPAEAAGGARKSNADFRAMLLKK